MKNLNKLFMLGFNDDIYINSFLEENHFSVMERKDFLIERALNENMPLLFFVEKYNVFKGDWVSKYLQEIQDLYPFSKFILNITKSETIAPETWSLQSLVLKHFIKDDNGVDKFLLSRQIPNKYGISFKSEIGSFGLNNFMLFDNEKMSAETMEDFISEDLPADQL
jgi:hypothetical protein